MSGDVSRARFPACRGGGADDDRRHASGASPRGPSLPRRLWPRLALGVGLLVALVAGGLRVVNRSPGLEIYFDSYECLLVARAMRSGEFTLAWGASRRPPFHPPGYPAAILLTAGGAEPAPATPALTSAVSGALTPLLAFVAGEPLVGVGAAAIAALFWALNPLHAEISESAMSDATALALCLLAAALWLAARGALSAVLAGLLLGAAVLTRYSELLVLVWLVLLSPGTDAAGSHDRGSGVGRRRRTILAIAGLAAVLAPFAVWHATTFGLGDSGYGPLGRTFALSHAFVAPHDSWMLGPDHGHLVAYLDFLLTGLRGTGASLAHSPALVPLALVALLAPGSGRRLGRLLVWAGSVVLLYSLVWNSEPRYMLDAYVPLAWLAARGVMVAWRRGRVLGVLALLGLLVPPTLLSGEAFLRRRPLPPLASLGELTRACPADVPLLTAVPLAVAVYAPERVDRVVLVDGSPFDATGQSSGAACIVVEDVLLHSYPDWLDATCRAFDCRETSRVAGLELVVTGQRVRAP
jgi:4-amino-4-deoxy-L-arabinose transferase-like glycosyltransferase